LTGPAFKNLDLSLAKSFELNKRVRLQVRLDAYNAQNGMSWANPNLTITSSDFGRTNTQAAGYYGRQIQCSARLQFYPDPSLQEGIGILAAPVRGQNAPRRSQERALSV
jgi:hypothetical protein